MTRSRNYPKNRRIYTQADKDAFFALFEECQSTTLAAHALGFNVGTCSTWVWKAGLKSQGVGGRAPHPGKDEYFQRRKAGLSRRAAADAVGVHLRTAEDWDNGIRKHGHRRYFPDGRVIDYNTGMTILSDPPHRGVSVPLSRLQKQLDPRFLSLEEREQIRDLLRDGVSMRRIAAQLGRAPSTISREVTRNQSSTGIYHPFAAQRRSAKRRPRPKTRKLVTDLRLRAFVEQKLALRWSPEQISHALPCQFPNETEMRVAAETIYQALYLQGRGRLRRGLATPLRTGRARRRSTRATSARRPRFSDPMVMISERPAEAADRAVPGHWEGDLIVGAGNSSAIGTLVERSTRFVKLVHLPNNHTAETVRDGLIETMSALPSTLKKSLTWDQGTEMAAHKSFAIATNMDVYFCDPASPWQRGTNENTNGLLRQYFPKGSDLSQHTASDLAAVAHELNTRPRKTLGWETPAERLAKLLAA